MPFFNPELQDPFATYQGIPNNFLNPSVNSEDFLRVPGSSSENTQNMYQVMGSLEPDTAIPWLLSFSDVPDNQSSS
jgi:hypothetical protein